MNLDRKLSEQTAEMDGLESLSAYSAVNREPLVSPPHVQEVSGLLPTGLQVHVL